MSATYTTAHGNTGSLTHFVSPGIEPVSSRMLVRFISAEPQWELQASFTSDQLAMNSGVPTTSWDSIIHQNNKRTTFFIFFFPFFFLGPHLQDMEVPRLAAESELELPAYPTAMAAPDLSHICDLRCSLLWLQILNPLSEVRNWTHIFMDTMSGS